MSATRTPRAIYADIVALDAQRQALMVELGIALAHARQRRGLTQQWVARRFDTDRCVISHVERASRKFQNSADLIRRLVDLLGGG